MFLFALTLNFNGGQFYREISNFGYFQKLEKSAYRQKQWKILSIYIQIQELIKNQTFNVDIE